MHFQLTIFSIYDGFIGMKPHHKSGSPCVPPSSAGECEVLQRFSDHTTQVGLLGCLSLQLQGPKHDVVTDSPSKGRTTDFLSCGDF